MDDVLVPEGTVPFAPGLRDLRIAILVPCYNEELTIGKVIADFRAELPWATVYVFDNNSTDRTAEIARRAGAIVMREPRQGKGFVVQSMFRRVDADLYVMVDGDDTYPASAVRRLVAPIVAGEADMVVGSRLHADAPSGFRRLNLVGNRLFLSTLNAVFRVRLSDILSGYRAFSRTFVKTIPLVGGGFEVETELTIKSLEAGFRIAEVPVDLGARPDGSSSKIRPFADGLRILSTIFALLRDYKPLTFFGSLALGLVGAGLVPGGIVILEYLRTGLVLRLPSAVLAVGLVLLGMLMLTAGLVLHSMTRRIRELEYQLRGLAMNDHADAAAPRRAAG
jgi:glycosyltransferase involved in cell wall biosynthesis